MKNPTAVVTGASRGLGKAIALAFASVGAKVALLFRRNITEASLVARRIEDQGGTAWAFQCDVADSAVVNQTINDVVRRAGGVDVLVNNAGVSHSSLLPGTDEAIWDDVIATNLTGAFNCTRAVLPCMLKQKRGHIVNIGSLSGMRGVSGGAVYSASKAALVGLTLSTAREYGSRNIAANVILPGFIPTDMGTSMPLASRERILAENVLGRGSTIQQVAAFVVRLTQTEGLSGQVFNLDSRPWQWV